jgi:hypothetical protein
MRRLVTIIALSALTACFPHARTSQLRRRAAFDLQCPSAWLVYHTIDSRTRGVEGCGREATYVESCDRRSPYASTECTWLLDGATRTQ